MRDLYRTVWVLVVFGAVLAAMSAPAIAQSELTVGVHLYSHHVPRHDWQEQRTPGVYVRHDSGATAGVFRNTLGRTSFYGGFTGQIVGPLEGTLGLMSGYRLDAQGRGVSNAHLVPLASLSVVGPEIVGVRPRLSLMPRASGMNSTVLHLSIEARL